VLLIINRTIFRWLTAKNFHALEFDTEQPTPPEKLLAAFKSGTGSYARAFEYMARYVFLGCIAVVRVTDGVVWSLSVCLSDCHNREPCKNS